MPSPSKIHGLEFHDVWKSVAINTHSFIVREPNSIKYCFARLCPFSDFLTHGHKIDTELVNKNGHKIDTELDNKTYDTNREF